MFTPLKEYFNKQSLKVKKIMAVCFMGDVVTYGNKTNNVLETHSCMLKTLATSTDARYEHRTNGLR